MIHTQHVSLGAYCQPRCHNATFRSNNNSLQRRDELPRHVKGMQRMGGPCMQQHATKLFNKALSFATGRLQDMQDVTAAGENSQPLLQSPVDQTTASQPLQWAKDPVTAQCSSTGEAICGSSVQQRMSVPSLQYVLVAAGLRDFGQDMHVLRKAEVCRTLVVQL